MPHYQINHRKSTEDSGYDSGYESDGGTTYSPVKSLGAGHYAQARLFQSISNQTVAVLKPVRTPGDIEEALIKHRFFQTIYPDSRSHLHTIENDYRLVVPYLQYVPYTQLTMDTPELHKRFFLSAIQALTNCHDKGMSVLDLKADNILYDATTYTSYLIDGGLSAPLGSRIDPAAFQDENQTKVEARKNKHWYIAPECWSVRPIAVLATEAMDIHCLGALMYNLLENTSTEMNALVDSCLEIDPQKRPTLAELMSSLECMDLVNMDLPKIK